MSREPTKLTLITVEALSVSERVLLFCLASDTPLRKAGVTERTVLNIVIKGMVERWSVSPAHTSCSHGRGAMRSRLCPAAELGAGSRNFACVFGLEPDALTLSYPRTIQRF